MEKNNRIILVDALRGFALMGIVLIHCIEHLDFFREPNVHFLFSNTTDKNVMAAIFFLISGKAYSIFALMFGLSFFIQMNNKEIKGVDFRWRFAWRLTVLLIIGFIHSLFYKGDILHIYAILGFILILLYKFKTKHLIWIACILVLQIPMVCTLISTFLNPKYVYNESFGSGFWDISNQTYATGSLLDVIKFNFWHGREMVWGWMFYNGRYLQLVALFIIGLVVGRNGYFENITKYKKEALKYLILSIAIVLFFFLLEKIITLGQFTSAQKTLLHNLIHSFTNLAYTSVIIFTFIVLYIKFSKGLGFDLLASFGKMSLSNYIFQAMTGVIIFFGFGFGIYRYMGTTWSLIFGLLFVSLQIVISKWWGKNFYYGPLEWVWRAITYFDFSIKFRKEIKQ